MSISMDPNRAEGKTSLEKRISEVTLKDIAGEIPENYSIRNPFKWASRKIKRTTYKISDWAVQNYNKKIENKYWRFGLGYLISLQVGPLIPEDQRNAMNYLNIKDPSYASKHDTTTVPATLAAVEHYGLFKITQSINFLYGLEDFAFWANLTFGIGSNFWRQYMAFKDELENPEPISLVKKVKEKAINFADNLEPCNELTQSSLLSEISSGIKCTMNKLVSDNRVPIRSKVFTTIRKKGYKTGKYLQSKKIFNHDKTKWFPRFFKYTFSKGSKPTPSISWRFLINQPIHESGKALARKIKERKD